MLFAGFNVSDGDLTLSGSSSPACSATWSAPGSPTRSATTAGIDLLEQNKLIHINPKHLAWADRWFERHGDATVFFARMLPIIRTFISLPGRGRADAVLALHLAHRARLHPLGARLWR